METMKGWFGYKRDESSLHIQEGDTDPTLPLRETVPKPRTTDTDQKKPAAFKQLKENQTFFFSKNMSFLPMESSSTYNKSRNADADSTTSKPKVDKATELEEHTLTGADNSEKKTQPSPLKDCIQCKVIGVTAVTGAMLYVLYHGRRNQHMYTGVKKVAFMGQYLFLSAALGCMVISVAFDTGPFQARREGDTLKDVAKQDFRNFTDKLSQLSSSSSSSR